MNNNKNPYRLPEGYFEKLQAELKTQTNLPKKTGFSLPKGYFENMQDQVMEKASTPKENIIPLRNRSWVGMAASMLVMLCAGLWLWSNDIESVDNTLADISETSVLEYLSADELTMDQYAMILDELDIESIEIEEDIEDDYLDLLDETHLFELEDLL